MVDATLRDRVVDACGAKVRSQLRRDPVPDVLCHMTNVVGFLGIVNTRAFWASLATELNDASEVHHGIDLARDILRGRGNTHHAPYENQLLRFIDDPSSAPVSLRFESIPFVFSACRGCDRSGQWL